MHPVSYRFLRSGLLPWRQVVEPHPIWLRGQACKQAEFAADLAQVARGTAEVKYQDQWSFWPYLYYFDMEGLLVPGPAPGYRQRGEPVIQLNRFRRW